jgi:POT family proton-dependent oligopeptide transporter
VYGGAILMAIGHFMMAAESMFFPALMFLILGNGMFKPNLVSQVGNLYKADDPRKDRAYMIYYMGVNLGAFLSPLICGTLGQKYGWHYGFGAAGVGMVIGLFVYHFGRNNLPKDLLEKRTQQNSKVHKEEPLTRNDWEKIGALVFLCIVNIAFWSVYEQQGNTLQLWADEKIDWNVGGFLVPSTWYQSLNPVFILMLTPLITRFWVFQEKSKSEPNTVSKMALGCLFAAFSYLMMYYCVDVIGAGLGSLWWLVGTVLLFTIGELYLSPIGLSLVSKLAPAKFISLLMGLWFLSSFFGNTLAGYLGGFYETMGQKNFFLMLASLSAGAAVVFYLAKWPLKKHIP